MNYVHISVCIHFVWLIWLSLQFYDHDVAIARITGLVPPNDNDDDDVGDDYGVLDDKNLDSLHNEEDLFQLHSDSAVHSKDLDVVDDEISPHKHHVIQINRNKKKYLTNEMRGYTSLPRDIRKSSESSRKRYDIMKVDRKPMRGFSRRAIQNPNEDSVETKCFLTSYDNSTFLQTFDQSKVPSDTATFTLDFDLTTDFYASESFWSLVYQAEDSELIIDSTGHDVVLSPNTLQKFKYSCFVTLEESEGSTSSAIDTNKSKTCYTFTLSDEWGDGICCWGGLGFYSLKINDKFPLMSGRFYAHVVETRFCLEGDEFISDVDINKLLYPSRECIGETCLCDLKPKLLPNPDNIEMEHPDLSRLKIRTFANILTLSGTDSLKDTNLPQYMAACWALNDDPYLTQYESIKPNNETDAETRMMQRYILAVHYFSTTPRNWRYDLNFLSSKSECEWYTFDEIDNDPLGMSCDENNNIIAVLFDKINIEGPLVDEFSGLKSLEFMAFVKEFKLSGSIPSSFGLLSGLRYLNLEDVALVSTIPPELFLARRLERLMIVGASITGTIPEAISKLDVLQVLRLRGNSLTGGIPEGLYSLTQLRQLFLHENELSSTISSSIGNLNKLNKLRLGQNKLSGSLPSELGKLSMLEEMELSNNEFTSTVPSSLKSLSSIGVISLNGNRLEGEVPYALCELHPLPDIRADCRNDIFPPDLKCACCSYCADSTPIWNGKCPDSTLKIVFDHIEDGYWFSSESLEWSITDTMTNKQIIGDKYMRGLPLKPVYEMCIASTDCLLLKMKSDAIGNIHDYSEFSSVGFETPYYIYWNDNLLFTDIFASDIEKPFVQPDVLFQYDPTKNQAESVSSCVETEMICGDMSKRPTYQQHVYHKAALKVSGTAAFDDINSPHSKALCWIINNEGKFHQSTEHTAMVKQFTQRYVLTLLHLTSETGLFGDDEFPPLSHECKWKGVTCYDGKNKIDPSIQTIGKNNKMTSLILSPAANQIIGGTLIPEIGNLPFLEILYLNQTGLEGTVPDVFSNLYNLRELNLSDNNLTGSISDDFFDQLERVELFDLSSNSMTGMIPARICSHSNIMTIRLNKNRFTGGLPLDGFTKFELKHLDVSENQLSGKISPSLLKHIDLEYLNLGENFFIGSIEERIFDDLAKLEYFNVSKNELTGCIPSFTHKMYDITHFDMHANRFTGTIPTSLSRIARLEYLNLQGNRITGSIPTELNNLENLELLSLSHNQLKGPIPLALDKVPNLKNLHLQANELSGRAPAANRNMKEYITDCGYPSVSLDPIDCPSCSICCNSEDLCKFNGRKQSLKYVTAASMLGIMIILLIFYKLKGSITSDSRFFSERVGEWSPMLLINEKSVYHFFLTKNKVGWHIALVCMIIQMATLFLFVEEAESYDKVCQPHSLECEEAETSAKITHFGKFIFAWILFVWLTRDFIGSIKLMLLSLERRNIDYMFASGMLLLVTVLSAWTSVYYNLLTRSIDTELIVDTVILLFILEEDERLYQLISSIDSSLVIDIERDMRESASFNGEGNDLIIGSFIKKNKERFQKIAKKMPFRSKEQQVQNESDSIDSENGG